MRGRALHNLGVITAATVTRWEAEKAALAPVPWYRNKYYIIGGLGGLAVLAFVFKRKK